MSKNESRPLLFQPPKHQPSIGSLLNSPVLVSFDPGGTTGYSVMQVHPEALSEPDVKILDNIQFHSHGQIDCGSQKGNAGNGIARSAVEVVTEDAARRIGGGKVEGLEAIDDWAYETISGGDPLGISISGESAGVSEMMSIVDSWPGAATLIEDFILQTAIKDRNVLSAVRVTAAAEFCLWMMGRIEVPRQTASLAKTTVTDDRLKAWGLYRRDGGMKHARDADRHAITFFRRCSQGESGRQLRMLAWPYLYGIIDTGGKQIIGPYYKEPAAKGKNRA